MVAIGCERCADQSLAQRLKCGICYQIDDQSVETQCQHRFCYECLNQWVGESNADTLCPQCRRQLTADWMTSSSADSGGNAMTIGGRVLVVKNRILNEIVAQLKIRCDYELYGCQELCPLESLSAHIETCPHRLCPTCDLSISGQSPDEHNCIDDLKADRNKWQQKCKEFESEYNSLRSAAEELASKAGDSANTCRESTGECGPNGNPLDDGTGSDDSMSTIKCVAVGDRVVDKMALFLMFAVDYSTSCGGDTNELGVEIDGKTVKITLSTINHDKRQLWPLTYLMKDVFLICFSIVNRESFVNAKEVWAPEVSHHCPNAAIVLVGTDEHLRPGILNLISQAVTYSEGMAAARGMGAYKYVECSAVTGDGVEEVFDAAVCAVLWPQSTHRQSKRTCILS